MIEPELNRDVLKIVALLISKIPGVVPTAVGGAVRDLLWDDEQKPAVKDIDLEIFGASHEQIVAALAGYYELDLVGKQFGVLKVKGKPIDISLPRTESCIGVGHKDFNITVDPSLTPETAALRRDFTINAVSLNLRSWHNLGTFEGCIIDPFNGRADINARILHPVSDKFEEDPLRALRAMQFIARFDLRPTNDLIKRCAAMKDKVAALPRERVQEEWNKLILKGKKISKGLNFLVDTGLIDLYPELKALIGVPQSPKHHPEGDCWIHNCQVVDAFATMRSGNEADDLTLGYAALCHDLGKATTTKINPDTGDWCAHGHEGAGVPLTRSLMERIFDPAHDIIKIVQKLVNAHMNPVRLWNDYQKGMEPMKGLRRLAVAVDSRLDLLMKLVNCDQLGRYPATFSMEPIDWVNNILKEGTLYPPEGLKPILMGRHLIEQFKIEPGPEMGSILKKAFEAQLDGLFTDLPGAIEYARSHLLKTT